MNPTKRHAPETKVHLTGDLLGSKSAAACSQFVFSV